MEKTILITGGAGFIGINSAESFIKDGWRVILLDNLSRKGSDLNLENLRKKFPDKFEFIQADVRYDHQDLEKAAQEADVILHLAGQVAVTTSVANPQEDFEINALGTLNILEAARKSKNKPLVIYSSTNKVYGKMEDIATEETELRYRYKDLPYGVSEDRILDFHSPYGSSKGAADQYTRDYARIYDLPTVVFRQSCIYGPNQLGVEDQGWVAWFSIAGMLDKTITLFGDGKQVRDILHVHDLIEAYKLAIANPEKVKGKIYNVGGGPEFSLSLLELLSHLENYLNKPVTRKFSDWRPGDQPVYISNIRSINKDLGWQPKIAPQEGLKHMLSWITDNKETIMNLFSDENKFDASIICPTYNRAESLARMLESVVQLDYPRDKFEVVIVDNNCTDNTPEVAEKFRTRGLHVKYVKESRLSFTVARHAGAESADGEILIFVDDDVTVEPDWLKAKMDVFHSDSRVGIVAGHIEPKFEAEPPTWALAAQEMFNGWSLCNYSDRVADAPGACGPSFAIRKSVLKKVGGFPPDTIGVESDNKPGTVEKIYIGPGDWGLSLKVRDAGYKMKFAPKALVYHHVPPVRLTWKWWKSRHKGEGYMLAITNQIWHPKSRMGLLSAAFKNLIRASKLYLRYLQKIKRKDPKQYGYRLLIDNVITQARVQFALARNPKLAPILWKIGLTGVASGEINKLIRILPKV